MDINIKTIIDSLYTPSNSVELGITIYKKNPDFLKDYLEIIFTKLETSQKKELIKIISQEDDFNYQTFLNFKNNLESEYLNNNLDAKEYKIMSSSIIISFLRSNLDKNNVAWECNEVVNFLNSLELINIDDISPYNKKINILKNTYNKETVFENIAPLFKSIIEDKQFSKESFFESPEIKEVYKRNSLLLGEKTGIYFNKNDKEFYNFIVSSYIFSKNNNVLTPKLSINKDKMYSLSISDEELIQLKEITKNVKIETSLAQLLIHSKKSCEFISHFIDLKSYKKIVLSSNKVFAPIIIKNMVENENDSIENFKTIFNSGLLSMLNENKILFTALLAESTIAINEKTQYLCENLDIPLKEFIIKASNKTKKLSSLLKKPKEIDYLLRLTTPEEAPIFSQVNLYNLISSATFSESTLNETNNETIKQFFNLIYKDITLPEVIEKINSHNFSSFKASVEEKRQRIQNLLEKKIIEQSIDKIEEKHNNKKIKI